jgi:hypothetical protein
MIGIGLDAGRQHLTRKLRIGGDHQVIALFACQPRADPRQLRRQRGNAIAFLDAQVRDAGEPHRRLVECGEHRERGHRVLHLRAVDNRRQSREHRDELRRLRVRLREGLHRHAKLDAAARQRLCGP